MNLIVKKRKIVFLFFILFLVSCESMNEPVENIEYSLISNLIVNEPVQKIFIYRTLGLSEKFRDANGNNNYRDYFSKNADITIYDDTNFPYHFKMPNDTSKHYLNETQISIIPGKSYSISININGNKIFGETVVPNDFKIIKPMLNQHFINNNILDIPIQWSNSLNSMGYLIKIYKPFNVNPYSIILRDTSFVFKRGVIMGEYKFEIIAFDKNFYNHIIENIPSAGIDGAYGYFGSSVLKSVKIIVE